VIFDLDDTLIETSKCLTPYYLELAFSKMQQAGFEGDFNQLLTLNKRALSAKNALYELCPEKKILERGLEALSSPLPDEISLEIVPGALDVLEELQKNHTLALVTGGNADFQWKKLKKAGIQPGQFSKLVASDGPSKKLSYQTVLNELKFDPNETLVCGDRVPVDLSPAKELNLFTVHFRNGRGLFQNEPKADVDFSIDRLNQLHEVFEKA